MRNITAIVMMSLLLISGCTNAQQTQSENNNSAIAENITINGGSVGGVWSIFTEGVSEAVRKEYPGTMVSTAPGTVAGNPVLVAQEKVEFAISESLTARFAYDGMTPFDDQHKNIRAVATMIPENVFQFVAPASAPFDSVEEISEMDIPLRYSPGEKDALGDIVSASIFESYGMSYQDIQKHGEINFLSGKKTFELMRDDRIDGLGKMVPIPAGDILEASANIDLKFISIGQTAIDHLVNEFDMSPFTIEAGSYEFQTGDYQTVNTPTILVTHANVSDEIVFKMTKSIYEQLDYLRNVHDAFTKVTDETIVDVGNVPLHSGAEEFFKEAGLLD